MFRIVSKSKRFLGGLLIRHLLKIFMKDSTHMRFYFT